jgi:hypothetical protein
MTEQREERPRSERERAGHSQIREIDKSPPAQVGTAVRTVVVL